MADIKYEVVVDTDDVENLLMRLETAISPLANLQFLEHTVYPWMVEETVQRFAYAGDYRSKDWPELQESTERIRSDLGYDPDWPINIRTGNLFQYVTSTKNLGIHAGEAELQVPGPLPDAVTAKKFLTAQMGDDMNPMIPGAITPPRPVLAWVEEADAQFVLLALAQNVVRVMQTGVF